MRLEVRCCCQPTKLLGYLPLPECVEPVRDRVVRFAIPPRFHPARSVIEPARSVALPIGEMMDATGYKWLAFKSEETPIETLRQIPGFLEARP